MPSTSDISRIQKGQTVVANDPNDAGQVFSHKLYSIMEEIDKKLGILILHQEKFTDEVFTEEDIE